MAPTGISGGPPELRQLRRLRHLWRLRRLQEFLGDPRNYGAKGFYDAYGACRLGQAPNPNPNPLTLTLTQYLALLNRETFKQYLARVAAPPLHPPASRWVACINLISIHGWLV